MDSSKIAFLFPGQGVQKVGMGKDLYDNIPECKELLDKSEEILNMPVKEMMFEGPDTELLKTENSQPTILLASLLALKALEVNGIEADYTTGLSLGEYGSLIYGKVLNIEDGLKLIKERGRIMGSALPEGLGTMAAILKLSNEQVDEVLKRASEYGICEGANYNCPGQVTISGEFKAVEKACEIAKELGGIGKMLKVGGPFHCSLLKGASDEFYETIKKVSINKFDKNVYSNTKGALYTNDDDVRLLLKKHIMSSVYLEKSLRDMIDRGVTTFIEVGPGRTMRGFVKKIDKSLTLLNVEDMDSLKNTLEVLKNN